MHGGNKIHLQNEYIATMFLRQETDLFNMFFFFLSSFLFFNTILSVLQDVMRTILNFMVLIQRRELVCDQHRYNLHKMTELQPAISNIVTHDLMPHIFIDIFVYDTFVFF